MISAICNSGKITIIVGILFISATVDFDSSMAATSVQPTTGEIAPSENSAIKPRTSGPSEEEEPPSSFFPIEAMHKMIREEREAIILTVEKDLEAVFEHLTQERLAVLLEMENMRNATLGYLTGERTEVMEQLIAELNRITDLLVAERQTTLLELEVAGNRMTEGALKRSERLVDHFFIRLSQLLLTVALVLGIAALIVFRVLTHRKRQAY